MSEVPQNIDARGSQFNHCVNQINITNLHTTTPQSLYSHGIPRLDDDQISVPVDIRYDGDMELMTSRVIFFGCEDGTEQA